MLVPWPALATSSSAPRSGIPAGSQHGEGSDPLVLPGQPLTTTATLTTTEQETTALGRCCLKQDHNFI